MKLEANTGVSYKGRDILNWCKDNTEDCLAETIFDNYFSSEVPFRPNLNAYYTIWVDSRGNSFHCIRLERDINKSPRHKIQ